MPGYRQVPTSGSDMKTSSTGTLVQVVPPGQLGEPPLVEQKARHLFPLLSPVTHVLPPLHSFGAFPGQSLPTAMEPSVLQKAPAGVR